MIHAGCLGSHWVGFTQVRWYFDGCGSFQARVTFLLMIHSIALLYRVLWFTQFRWALCRFGSFDIPVISIDLTPSRIVCSPNEWVWFIPVGCLPRVGQSDLVSLIHFRRVSHSCCLDSFGACVALRAGFIWWICALCRFDCLARNVLSVAVSHSINLATRFTWFIPEKCLIAIRDWLFGKVPSPLVIHSPCLFSQEAWLVRLFWFIIRPGSLRFDGESGNLVHSMALVTFQLWLPHHSWPLQCLELLRLSPTGV